jgi:hypothetical protein
VPSIRATIVVRPTARPVATPAPSTVATSGADERQVTATSRTVRPSPSVTAAANAYV